MEFVIDGEVWKWTRARRVHICPEDHALIPRGGRGFRSSQNHWVCKECGEAMAAGKRGVER